MDSDGNRAYILTPTDRGGLLVIIATVLMSWMVFCFFTRLYMRFAITGPFALDDAVAGIGTVSPLQPQRNAAGEERGRG
jgi:hypothetical protein